MSEHLKIFCREVLMILESGNAPEWFDSKCGLCFNSREYDRFNEDCINKPTYSALRKELGWEDDYPFNFDDQDYINESYAGLIYKNEKRLAFLHKHANL